MSEQNSDQSFSIYIPLSLIVAFLIGCLSIALISVRENIYSITSGSVSDSDYAHVERHIRKSQVYEDSGLKYRMVSAADLGLGETHTGSQEEKTQQASASPVSSDDEKKISGSDKSLQLPMDRYVNFVPHKTGYTAYLTFDDGPSENTEAILDILDFYGVKATFFVIYHKGMDEQYKAIVNRGHTIALHTYTHDYRSVYTTESGFFEEMEQISDYIYTLTGVRTKIMRFPGGSSNTVSRKYNRGIMSFLKKNVIERGYVYQDWNVDSCDAESANTPPKKLMSNIRSSLKDNKTAMVLMHDAGNTTNTTVEALPQIIEFFLSEGYALEKIDMNTEQIHHNWCLFRAEAGL